MKRTLITFTALAVLFAQSGSSASQTALKESITVTANSQPHVPSYAELRAGVPPPLPPGPTAKCSAALIACESCDHQDCPEYYRSPYYRIAWTYGLLKHAGDVGAGDKDPLPVTRERLERGRMIYSSRCAFCHGERGQGAFMWHDGGTMGGYHYGPPLDIPAIRDADYQVPIGTLHWIIKSVARGGFNGMYAPLDDFTVDSQDGYWDVAEFLQAGEWGR